MSESSTRSHRRSCSRCSAPWASSSRRPIEETPDNIRLNLAGDGAEVLLRRKGEALDALQVIVNTVFRRDARGDRHYVVDALGFRSEQGRRTAADGALPHGEGEDHRRAAGDRPAQSVRAPASCTSPWRKICELSSESIGDAFLKTRRHLEERDRRRAAELACLPPAPGARSPKCSPPPTRSSRLRHRPGAAALASCGSRVRTPSGSRSALRRPRRRARAAPRDVRADRRPGRRHRGPRARSGRRHLVRGAAFLHG